MSWSSISDMTSSGLNDWLASRAAKVKAVEVECRVVKAVELDWRKRMEDGLRLPPVNSKSRLAKEDRFRPLLHRFFFRCGERRFGTKDDRVNPRKEEEEECGERGEEDL